MDALRLDEKTINVLLSLQKAMLAFTEALTRTLKQESSLSVEAHQALDDLQRSSAGLSSAYSGPELERFLDMSMHPIRQRQGMDLLRHMEARM